MSCAYQKHISNDIFLVKTPETKKVCKDTLRGVSDLIKQKKICCLGHPGVIFVQNKKALLVPKP
jgi:hypothetical protein